LKIVCDTNVLISALVFSGGLPDKILRAILANRLVHFISPDLLGELVLVLQKKFRLPPAERVRIVELITDNSTMVYPVERLALIKSDPTDNRVLECAVEARAQFLVSGDKKHLLPLIRVKQVRIVSPAEFVCQCPFAI
jgi:uncharacterized protein